MQNLSVPTDRRVWMECRALIGAGRQVTVICPGEPGDPRRRVLEGVVIRTYPQPRKAEGYLGFVREFLYCWLRTAWLSLVVLRREGFDVMQACNPPDTYWLLGLLYRPLGKRFVYDQHDLCPELFATKFGTGAASRLAHRAQLVLERATYAVSDEVIVTNESYYEIAQGRGHVPEAHLTIVRSAPDPEQMRAGPEDPRLRRGRRNLVVYLGIMGSQDGVDRFLHAVAHLVHRAGRTDTHFGLLGFGDSLDDLRALATELDVDDWVTFTGRVGEPEIRSWLSTADIGVTPDPINSFNDRATMNKTLEYMAFGLPVVASDLRETRRSAGDAARYVDPDDTAAFAAALSAMLDDPGLRSRLGTRGRRRIETDLCWPRQAQAYLGLYARLLDGEPVPEPADTTADTAAVTAAAEVPPRAGRLAS